MAEHDVDHLLDLRLATLSLGDLRAFLLALGEGSVRGAADRLGVTQPAVSARLRSLRVHFEAADGDARDELHLLAETRGRAGVKPTEYGAIVEHYGARILRLVGDMEREVEQRRRGIVGQVRVGASVTIAENLLPQLIADFHREFPAYRVDLYAGNVPQIQQMVRDGGLDFGIVASDPNEGGWLKVPLCADYVVAFVAAERAVDRRAFADERQQFVVREVESQAFAHARKFLRRHGRELDLFQIGNTNATVINLTTQGLGIGILSNIALGYAMRDGRVVPVRDQLQGERRRHHKICRPRERQRDTPDLAIPALALWDFLEAQRVGAALASLVGG